MTNTKRQSYKFRVIVAFFLQVSAVSSETAIREATKEASKSQATPISVTLVYSNDGVRMPCAPVDPKLSPIMEPQYSWTYHGRPDLTVGRVDEKNGDLVMHSVHSDLAGVYECWVSGKDSSGNIATAVYAHELVVYVLPEILLEKVFLFKVPKCAGIMDTDIVKQYHAKLCKAYAKPCPFEVLHNCTQHPRNTTRVHHHVRKKNGDVLIMTVHIKPAPDFQPPLCSLECIRMALATHLYDMKVKAQKDWTELLKSKDKTATKWYEDITEKRPPVITEKCSPGFTVYGKSVCAACQPGSYWEQSGQCQRCPSNSYSDRAAQLECALCSPGHHTANPGATNAHSCLQRGITSVFQGFEQRQKNTYMTVGVVIVILCGVAFVAISLYLVCMRCDDDRDDPDLRRRMKDAEKYEKMKSQKVLVTSRVQSQQMI